MVGPQGREGHAGGQVYTAPNGYSSPKNVVNQDTSAGLTIVVGKSYHLKLRTLNNTHFEFSINGLDQFKCIRSKFI